MSDRARRVDFPWKFVDVPAKPPLAKANSANSPAAKRISHRPCRLASPPPQRALCSRAMLLFRPASAADLSALTDLVNCAYRGDSSRQGWTTEADLLDGQRTDLASLNQVLLSPGHTLLLALDASGHLQGCVHTILETDLTLYFGMLTVRPGSQAQGIGRQLLIHLEELARAAGCIRLRMTVIQLRSELIAWYQRRGFRATGRVLPFPMGDARFGVARVGHLELVEFEKVMGKGG